MLTAQPSTYDMFQLIELFGRKVKSEYDVTSEPNPTGNACGSLQYRRLKNSPPSEPFLPVLQSCNLGNN